MESNYEYISEFVQKHNYNKHVQIQCYGQFDTSSIKYVIFDRNDVPNNKKISIEDIQYDIISDLPKDAFYRWLEYLENGGKDISYIQWVTSKDILYQPMGIDKTDLDKFKNEVYQKIEDIKKMKWFIGK